MSIDKTSNQVTVRPHRSVLAFGGLHIMNLETRKLVIFVAMAASYILAMMLYLPFSLLMTGGGDGQMRWIIAYAILSLPSSLLALIRYAFPTRSDFDLFGVIPLILAPTLNVVVIFFIRWVRNHRRQKAE